MQPWGIFSHNLMILPNKVQKQDEEEDIDMDLNLENNNDSYKEEWNINCQDIIRCNKCNQLLVKDQERCSYCHMGID